MTRAVILITALAATAAARGGQPIEGDWQVLGGGPELRISADTDGDGRLRIIWLDGGDMSLPEGTEMGYAVPTARDGVYDCYAYSDLRGEPGREGGKVHFVARMDEGDTDSFVIEPYDRKIVFNLRMLLPLWYRRAIDVVDERPRGLDGARRIGSRPRHNAL